MKRENGFTLIELLVVVAIIGILASIAIISMSRTRAAANEASAIASIRGITSAQIAYTATCGNGGFATTLVTLGVPPPGATIPFLSPDLTSAASVQKSGFLIRLAPSSTAIPSPFPDCNGTPTQTGYYASGAPVTFGWSGHRAFAAASPNIVIWQAMAAVAPAEPFALPATPLN